MSYPKICKISPEEYQERLLEISKSYSLYGTDALIVYSLGLSGECGEVSEILKRFFREGNYPNDQLIKELGDVIAYVTLLGNYFDIDLEDILLTNIQKLEDRKANGTLHGKGSDR